MRSALVEAEKGLGLTSPNPAVGTVIVKGSRILGRGFHHAAGQPHAEIEAIRSLKDSEQARGATLYVTLEPCSTHGRTPPCSEAILRHGFARVVYGTTDPNPAHAGRVDRILQRAGITVCRGVLETECAALNTAWNHWIVTGRPYVIAKCGMSLDGRISSHPESRWITSEASRADAMKLRARVDAILVGGETVRMDNPKLTLRGFPETKQPWRVVLTESGRLPKDAHLFTDEHADRTLVLEKQSLPAALATLGAMEITSVLIEGGGRTLGEAFDRKLVRESVIYVAPQMLGGPVPAIGGTGVGRSEDAARLIDPTYTRIGDDLRIAGKIRS
jgi:diaminohydroxyphosphoribosylaminopyrimidine deaminase/5-amino-6-(5-phosphoribosylamino)uracil reductase